MLFQPLLHLRPRPENPEYRKSDKSDRKLFLTLYQLEIQSEAEGP
jgi:hypothetical protein